MASTASASDSPSTSIECDPALVEDIRNPLYHHHSESPKAMPVSEVLIGENYCAWVQSMKNALIAKNKFGFVDGIITLSS